MTTTTGTRITLSIEESIATLTLNQPPVNALTPELLTELEAQVNALAADEAVKVLIITGTGRVFAAGADIHVLARIASSREGTEMALSGQAILNKIEALDKPVIAAINGACLGGGLELALCCHIRLAAEGARLGLPEITLGIMPGFGGTQRLPRLIGRSKATELILTGDIISAQEAKALRLVSQVVAPDDLLRHAQGLARRIAAEGPGRRAGRTPGDPSGRRGPGAPRGTGAGSPAVRPALRDGGQEGGAGGFPGKTATAFQGSVRAATRRVNGKWNGPHE